MQVSILKLTGHKSNIYLSQLNSLFVLPFSKTHSKRIPTIILRSKKSVKRYPCFQVFIKFIVKKVNKPGKLSVSSRGRLAKIAFKFVDLICLKPANLIILSNNVFEVFSMSGMGGMLGWTHLNSLNILVKKNIFLYRTMDR